MNNYDFYEWEEFYREWIWVGSDNGITRIKKHTFKDDIIDSFFSAYKHQLDAEHFIDEECIIDTVLITLKGVEMYVTKEDLKLIEEKYLSMSCFKK